MTADDGPRLTKVTVNLTQQTTLALASLIKEWRLNRTDTHNRAIRVAEAVRQIAPDGHLRIVRDDGTTADIYLV